MQTLPTPTSTAILTPTVYTQTPSQLICTLIKAGWTQEKIGLAVEVSQATICRIYSGHHKDPRYSVVEKLRHLVLSLDEFQRVV